MRIAAAGAGDAPLFLFRFPRYADFLFLPCSIEIEAAMQKTEHYKKFVLDARAHGRGDGQGWIAEICIVRRTSMGDVDTQFMLQETFASAEAAVEAALATARRKVDVVEPTVIAEQPSA
jgi:hypothetical protein